VRLKRYLNEIIVLFALFLMLGAYFYKNHQVTQQTEEVSKVKHSLLELKEVVALKKIWGDKTITKKVDALQKVISVSKVKWSQKQNKVTATYSNLSPNELNKFTTKLLNTPVTITLLEIIAVESNYNVEFKCKW